MLSDCLTDVVVPVGRVCTAHEPPPTWRSRVYFEIPHTSLADQAVRTGVVPEPSVVTAYRRDSGALTVGAVVSAAGASTVALSAAIRLYEVCSVVRGIVPFWASSRR